MTIWSREGQGMRRERAMWALWAVLPLLSFGYQICAEETARALAGTSPGWHWLGTVVTLPWFHALLACEAASFVAWMFVLGEMKLSAAFALSAVSYVLVIVASWTIFHEPGAVLQVMGSAAILAGVWLIGRGPPNYAV